MKEAKTRSRQLSQARAELKRLMAEEGKTEVLNRPSEIAWLPLGLVAKPHPPSVRVTAKGVQRHASNFVTKKSTHRV